MTTLQITLDECRETLQVRGDLTQASSPIEVNYGDGWRQTRFQAADTKHTDEGLADIGSELLAEAVGCWQNGLVTVNWSKV